MPIVDDLKLIAPKDSQREKAHPDQMWRASGLNNCPRKQILAAHGYHVGLNVNLLRKFAMHGGAHDNVQKWIMAGFSDSEEEVKVYDADLRCGGHIDAVVKDDDAAYVIEIKTYAFLKADPKPDSYWQHQMSFYYNTVLDMGIRSVVVPVVVIAGITDGYVRVVEPEVTDGFRDILFNLNLCWDTDTLPTYADVSTSSCSKCPLKPACTEPIRSISEFVEYVKARGSDGQGDD